MPPPTNNETIPKELVNRMEAHLAKDPDFSPDDIRKLKAGIELMRGLLAIWGIGKALAAIIAVLTVLHQFWDKFLK